MKTFIHGVGLRDLPKDEADKIKARRKSKQLDNLRSVRNRLLVETDSPYLSPEPLRGKKNEPSNIIHTVKFLSDLKGISYDDLCGLTSKNFFKLFGDLNKGS